ncbi:ABC-2 type transport system permease protein [Tamaricihabitans halophyticus]|uniref:ABC-2 type transport system permease protein n=1 Tax=Tamaricihabitans halophyticus TaxID=1262583 RepID=A0A4R2R454_9PSEU|nr:ABC transporter permease [Tamaricihabitans halophyticus]TCP56519.1 ABC-2 type transport system permease protein [Tamaricihabitans halophyticus]
MTRLVREGRRAVWLIARREIAMQLRSKGFAVSTGVIILVLAGYLLLHTTVLGTGARSTVGLTGQASAVAGQLRVAAEQLGHEVRTVQVPDADTGREQVADGELDVLVSGSPSTLRVLADSQLDESLRNVLNGLTRQQVLAAKLAEAGVEDPGATLGSVYTSQVRVDYLNPPDADLDQRLVVGLVLAVLLYMSVITYGMQVATGVVEEKSSRIVELLLATVRPWQLLLGKVAGIGTVGLCQLAIVGVVGLTLTSVTGVLTVSGVTAGALLWGLVWYLLGFFLYATVFAAAGSLVSRQEETQQVTGPMMAILVIGFVIGFNVLLQGATSSLAVGLSLVPLLSPIMMPARIAMGLAPAWQIAVAILGTLAMIALVTWLAGKIYGNAVLRTGSRVKLREALN